MANKLVGGVNAAAGTPRFADGSLDLEGLARTLEFLMDRGIRGFAINGATGEFCLTTEQELRAIVATAAQVTAGRATFVCGIGAAGLPAVLRLGEIAMRGGAKGLLLPMPYFFRYEQQDLASFCKKAAEGLRAPVLLYNLPQFSSGLSPETVVELIGSCTWIDGIKDSSGSLDILRRLDAGACRIVGSDNALAGALQEGICDGVISGVASVLPELITNVFGMGVEFSSALKHLEDFIGRISGFPVPWALKWIGESRGIVPAVFSQPVSPERLKQGTELQAWFQAWLHDNPTLSD